MTKQTIALLNTIADCEHALLVHVILNDEIPSETQALKEVIALTLKNVIPLGYCTVNKQGQYVHPVSTSGCAMEVFHQYDKKLEDEYRKIILNQ